MANFIIKVLGTYYLCLLGKYLSDQLSNKIIHISRDEQGLITLLSHDTIYPLIQMGVAQWYHVNPSDQSVFLKLIPFRWKISVRKWVVWPYKVNTDAYCSAQFLPRGGQKIRSLKHRLALSLPAITLRLRTLLRTSARDLGYFHPEVGSDPSSIWHSHRIMRPSFAPLSHSGFNTLQFPGRSLVLFFPRFTLGLSQESVHSDRHVYNQLCSRPDRSV